MRKRTDPNIHIGEEFDRLTIIAFDHQDSRYQFYYLCQCECGEQKVIRYSHLKAKKIVSCGKCYKPQEKLVKSLVGVPCGRLMPIERLEGNKYRCKCECGNETIVDGGNLRTKNTQSCGRCRTSKFMYLVGEHINSLTVEKYIGHSKFSCKCSCGKETIKRAEDLISGRAVSCGCASIKDLENKRFGNLIAKFWFRKDGKIYWHCKCDCGGEKDVLSTYLVEETTRSCGCLDVAHSGSVAENEIRDFIDGLGISVVQHNKSVLCGKEIDLYCRDIGVGIEYNGSVFHATLGAAFKNKEKTYHVDKFLTAKECGVHLITIFDVDWENNQEKIKKYLRSVLTKQKKIFARKCNISVIDADIACTFVDKHHIQGSNKATMKINYGLFCGDELLAVMSFGKLRMSKTGGGHFELHRYCVKDGYTVVGGANKLLKAFEKDYSPKYILSYSMNDYFIGGIYERLGFTNGGQCTPRYYWYLRGKELKRESCRLKHLKRDFPDLMQEAYDSFASNKEDYVMLKLGACKVYRSGTTKWEKFYANI